MLNGKLVHDEKKNSDCSLSGREVLSGLILRPMVCGLGLRIIQGMEEQERRASERERGGRVKVKERQTVKREPDYNLSARGDTNHCAHSSSAREDEISVSLSGHQNF